jgi:hypothetical protein
VSPLWPETVQLGIGPDGAAACSRRGAPALRLPLQWRLGGLPGGAAGAAAACPPGGCAWPTATCATCAWSGRRGSGPGSARPSSSHRFQAVFGAGPWAVLADRDAICLPSLGVALPAGLEAALTGFAA